MKQNNANSEETSSDLNLQPNVEEVKAENENDKLKLDNIIQHFPERMRSRARLIGSYLINDSKSMWNNRGELIYNDEPIAGSSITDLLYDACCPKRKHEPKGMEIFYKILHSLNLADGLIRNVDRRKWLNNSNTVDLKDWIKY